ncbi:MAG: hypothetical protein EXS64_04985 [Candidatus Latescibacteria bacterium]|nr:hypothetical protein [Candidatus Latescibacterota bacterium]
MALETWVMVGGWDFLDRYGVDRFLDTLQEAGVNHVAFGGTPPVEPDPKVYKAHGIAPLPPPPDILARADGVSATLRAARDRGMKVYLYGTNPHMSRTDGYHHLSRKTFLDEDLSLKEVESYWGVCVNCPRLLPTYRARLRDISRRFPCDGFLNDGPEFGYEIAPGFMGGNWNLFACFGPCCAQKAREMGVDLRAFQDAAGRLRGWLRNLSPAALKAFLETPPGLPDTFDLFQTDPALQDWLRFKTASIESYVKALCEEVHALNGRPRIGIGARTAAFAPLTGYDLSRIARHADFVLPKLYLWMGGYDGLYGTVYRWVRTLKSWNPQTPEDLLFQFVYRLFGFTLPAVNSLQDISRHIDAEHLDSGKLTHLGAPFPDEFYAEVVASETRKLLRNVGDPDRVRPWVCTSHGGRVLTPQELHLLLTGAEQGGLTTYLYYCKLEDGEWEVARRHAGRT